MSAHRRPIPPGRSCTGAFVGGTHSRWVDDWRRCRCARRQRATSRDGPRRRAATVRPRMAVDYRQVVERAEEFRANVANRKMSADVDRVVQMYDDFRALTTRLQQARTERNNNAATMKKSAKSMSAEQRQQCIEEGKAIKAQVQELEERERAMEAELGAESQKLPNLCHPDVPVGAEDRAVVLATVGQKRRFDFPVRSHVDIGAALDLFDFDAGAKTAGNKFYYLRNAGALLELALVNWATAEALRRGFTPVTTPDVARESVVRGCGFQPRGPEAQVYRLEETDLCLIGTAEIPLGGMYADTILDKSRLPIRMAAFSHCFRQEAGGAGSAVRGLYRVHQFSKVELFVITTPDRSEEAHAELRKIEEEMFESLGLHFKTLDMPTEDLGAPAYRKFDIEAWMPGRGAEGEYGEISSASNCTDYQARRLNIRYREAVGDNRFVHTLNGTACAVPRMIVAILENFQNEDGSVTIPEVLRPFMGNMQAIRT